MSQLVTSASASATMPLPSAKAMLAAAKIAIAEDRPIMMDYWEPSLSRAAYPGKNPADVCAVVGVKPDKSKLLIKSATEYTSTIGTIGKVDDTTLVVVTENSIYLISSSIGAKAISDSTD
jgi:hypothetical protein